MSMITYAALREHIVVVVDRPAVSQAERNDPLAIARALGVVAASSR